ncbi:MAG: M28 family metallopeptidase [Candidatus Eremiobacteraeota bacterium]|nr:M28 family metallopeptidase [Candidatus Eremiobacteraeota bacterium]MBV9055996.1 M28 family metallopeptidase [Candidatus Eremiobacteraeota bacterium]MBV9698616.1 M28 family metallopeptidase [Candidatus Eremiobacteraeota bacterium]
MRPHQLFALLCALAVGGFAVARGAAQPARTPYSPIASMVDAVNADRLQGTIDALVAFGTRNDFSEQSSTARHGVFAARDWIAAQLRRIAAGADGRMTVALDTYLQPKTRRTPRAVLESSVIATLRGDSPGRIYVMSSHFDDCDGDCTDGAGVAPGADDNGSGVAAVLEAARVMSATHFRGTIVFACFDGEELGLWGSSHFARGLAAAGRPVLAVLNNDIIGNSLGGDGASEPNMIRVFSQALPLHADFARVNLVGSENDSQSRELSRFIAETVPLYLPDFGVRQIFRADRFLRGGDQESFQDAGYSAAIRFVEPHENFTHQHQNVRVQDGVQYGDLPQYIDRAYLRRATQANVAALATLALGPAPPSAVQMVLKRLGYDSTLRWRAAPDAVSYEIVWRSTDAPQWQQVRNVGDVAQATVPVSKDDYVLAVRSVDSNGLRSPAVYPVAVRE